MSTGIGVNVSKANAYVVLEKPLALNISKANAYVVLEKPLALNVSKANAYVVLEKPLALNVSKANAYVVLLPINSNSPSWPVMSFVGGIVGVLYNESFDLSASTPNATVTVDSGSLPPGMSLTQLGAAQWKLTGTPTTAGNYAFTLKASNAYGSKTKDFTLGVISTSGQVADAFG